MPCAKWWPGWTTRIRDFKESFWSFTPYLFKKFCLTLSWVSMLNGPWLYNFHGLCYISGHIEDIGMRLYDQRVWYGLKTWPNTSLVVNLWNIPGEWSPTCVTIDLWAHNPNLVEDHVALPFIYSDQVTILPMPKWLRWHDMQICDLIGILESWLKTKWVFKTF